MYRRSLPLLLALAASSAAHSALAQRPDGAAISLSRAREAGAGASVLVDGVVSVAPGAFDGGFAIQDRTAGIWVLPPADPVLLRVGQRVRIRGTLDNPNNQLAIVPSAMHLFTGQDAPAELPDERPPVPRDVRTGAVDEEEEGWLVRIRGQVVTAPENDAPWGWKVMVDDGSGALMVFIDAETDVRANLFRVGAEVEVTGFAGQYDDHYELVPRAQADVRLPRRD